MARAVKTMAGLVMVVAAALPTLPGMVKPTHLFEPNPRIYWADLLVSAAIAWLSMGSWWLLPITALALLRAAYFIHELSHLGRGKLPGFALAWHALVGIPVLMPELMIRAHVQHHRTSTYGTARDPEYQPYAHWSRARIALDVAATALAPPLLALRFGVIGPLSWIVPPLRRITVRRLSTLAINPRFVREDQPDRAWIVQELAAAAWTWAAILLFSRDVLLHYWAAAALAMVLNQVRTLFAHRYENTGGPLDFDAQIADTITLGGGFLVELLAPLGDRFHAAHHRYPGIPYHNLAAAHRLLLVDRSYQLTCTRSPRAADPPTARPRCA